MLAISIFKRGGLDNIANKKKKLFATQGKKVYNVSNLCNSHSYGGERHVGY